MSNRVIAYQGLPGAYSEQAARAYFKRLAIKTIPCDDFDAVFRKVMSGKATQGVIPIENSLAGSIHENYDKLERHKVWISGEFKLRVRHNLLGVRRSQLSSIRQVYSHPQALAQCAKNLRRIGKLEARPFFDTAGAARYIRECGDTTIAAIGSELAAREYGLKVLKKDLEDRQENYTRFFVIQKKEAKKPQRGPFKTSIVYSLKNVPGALHKSLSIFALRDIDLFKIESRPLPGSPWDYHFYLDFAGFHSDVQSRKALDHLSEICRGLKVLGSYRSC